MKKCEMCNNEAVYSVEVSDKSEKVFLCEKCAVINEQIKRDKS